METNARIGGVPCLSLWTNQPYGPTQSYQAIYKEIAAAAQLTAFFLSFFAVQQLAGCAHAHAEWYREGA